MYQIYLLSKVVMLYFFSKNLSQRICNAHIFRKMSEVNDWQAGLDINKSVEYLYEHKSMADVTFNFPGQDPIRAHKVILGMRSSVFETMFYGSMAEVNGEVTITDIERPIFDLILRYSCEFEAEFKIVKLNL